MHLRAAIEVGGANFECCMYLQQQLTNLTHSALKYKCDCFFLMILLFDQKLERRQSEC